MKNLLSTFVLSFLLVMPLMAQNSNGNSRNNTQNNRTNANVNANNACRTLPDMSAVLEIEDFGGDGNIMEITAKYTLKVSNIKPECNFHATSVRIGSYTDNTLLLSGSDTDKTTTEAYKIRTRNNTNYNPRTATVRFEYGGRPKTKIVRLDFIEPTMN